MSAAISSTGLSCKVAIHAASALGSPVKPIDSARNAEPARISAIMQEVRTAPIRLSTKLSQVSERCTAASSRAPSTPNEAASVAVAKPR